MSKEITIAGAVVRAADITAAMLDANDDVQVGFLFEEGGCWSMARALADRFTSEGHQTRVRYQPGYFVHAWVEVLGIAYDWSGEMQNSLLEGALHVDLDGLESLAASYGVPADEFDAMLVTAEQVVEIAWNQLRQLAAAQLEQSA